MPERGFFIPNRYGSRLFNRYGFFWYVFSTIGSATLNFKVYNPQSQPVKISTIYFGGENLFTAWISMVNPARYSTTSRSRQDSLYVFIEVTIDPLGVNNPMNRQRFLILSQTEPTRMWAARIRTGYHLIDGRLSSQAVWTADKLMDHQFHGRDTGRPWPSGAGTQIFLHDQSSMVIWANYWWTDQRCAGCFSGRQAGGILRIVAGQWGTILIARSVPGMWSTMPSSGIPLPGIRSAIHGRIRPLLNLPIPSYKIFPLPASMLSALN